MSQAFFQSVAMPDRNWWQALWPEPAKIVRQLGISPGIEAIDLCCGDGYFTAELARLVFPASVTAVDLDAQMLAAARAECSDMNNCNWLQIDAMDLPARIEKPVDFIFMANTFHGVQQKSELAQAMHSSLKAEGSLAIVNWHPRPRENTPVLGVPRGPATAMRMSVDDLRAAIEPAGFSLSNLIELPPYHYAAIFSK